MHADTILTKALPPDHSQSRPTPWIAAWRAHLNAISLVVQEGWSTTLILEDDVDWDIRLKASLRQSARAIDYMTRTEIPHTVWLHDLPEPRVSKTSPYGSGWDVLWLGHCGMELEEDVSLVLLDDLSVPETRYQSSWNSEAKNPLTDFPPHTRAVVKGVHLGTCSLAYAVSQAGARKLLYSLGLQRLNAAFDLMLREWCEGFNGHERHVCYGVMPQLFDHHRPAGSTDGDSDIGEPTGQTRGAASTPNIQWSVRLNMEKLPRGDERFQNQYPDTL